MNVKLWQITTWLFVVTNANAGEPSQGKIVEFSANIGNYHELKLSNYSQQGSCQLNDRFAVKNSILNDGTLQMLLLAKLNNLTVRIWPGDCVDIKGVGQAALAERFMLSPSDVISNAKLSVVWEPEIVTVGEPANVTVHSTNTEYCIGDGGVKKGTNYVVSNVFEPKTRTITVRCYTSSGAEISRSATLTVLPAPTLNVAWFSSTVTAGQPSEARVASTNTDYCIGDGGVKKGTNYVVSNIFEPKTRTITVRCYTSSGAEISRSATLTVLPAPTLNVSWFPSTVTAGQPSEARVASTNTEYCVGDGGVKKGTSWVVRNVYESSSRTIRIRCYNALGFEISQSATLTVKPKPKPSLSVYWSPSRVKRGEASYAYISSYNTSYCFGDGGKRKGTSWVSGPIYEQNSRTITIRCHSADGQQVSRSATLTVTP